MNRGEHEPTTHQSLPVDRDVDAALQAISNPEATEEELSPYKALLARVEDPRTRIGSGRALLNLHREMRRIEEERDAYLREVEEALAPLRRQAEFLEAVFGDYAVRHRRAGLGNSFTLPGIGKWSTRKANARFEITDADKIIAVLQENDPDAYEQFTEQPPPPPPPPRKLLGNEFRKHLLDQLTTGLSAASKEDEDDDSRIARAATVGDAIAGAYGGAVVFHPERINPSADLNA